LSVFSAGIESRALPETIYEMTSGNSWLGMCPGRDAIC